MRQGSNMLAFADGTALFGRRSDDGAGPAGQAGGSTMHVARDARSGRTPGQGRLPARIPTGHKPKLLDQLRQALRSRHYSRRTEQTYCQWARRFIYFHHIRHPAEMSEPEINAFLTHLAVEGKVGASPQNQALWACADAVRVGSEVSESRSRLALAVGFSPGGHDSSAIVVP